MAGVQGHKFTLKPLWQHEGKAAKLSYVSHAAQALIYLLCKTNNYALVAHLCAGPGGTEVFCVSWDIIVLCPVGTLHVCVYMCAWAFSPVQQWLIKKKKQNKKKRGLFFFFPTAVVYLYLFFITWVLSKVMKREESFSKECFHIPAIWDGSCHLSPLTTMFGTQSPSQNLVRWQILSPPFITWSWKISSVLLAWFDLWSTLRAKIFQNEWKLEGIKKKTKNQKNCLYSQMDLLFALLFKPSWVGSVHHHLYTAACRHRHLSSSV